MKKRSFHQFEIKGLNQERFFNSLSKKYNIFEVDRIQKNLSLFKVNLHDRAAVKKEILDAGYQIVSEKSAGIIFLLSKFLLSFGLIAGIFISLTLYILQYQFVQRIEVWGIDDASKIERFVEENLPSMAKNKINIDEIVQSIKNEFGDLSFVSAAIVGQTLIINVKNSIIPPEMSGQFSPLVSQYDGVITSINLIQGTPMVAVGDIIQCGQILVEGKVTNSQGEVLYLQPLAEIEMDIWCDGEGRHFDSLLVTRRTGREKVETCVTLWGNEFYSHKNSIEFEQFEIETSSQPLSKNNILPFVLTKNIYFETETVVIESDFEEKREECFASAKENCLQKLPDCAIIKDEDYKIIDGAGCTIVRCVVTARLKVTGEYENLHK